MFAPKLVTAPATVPVTLEEAKLHLNVTHTEEDSLITALVLAATQHLDGYTGILGRCLITQTWEQEFKGLSARHNALRLQLAPANSVTSFMYTDISGAAQTLAASGFELLVDDLGPYLNVIEIPATDSGRIKVTYTAGYGDAAAVPEALKAAIRLHTGSLYEMREREVVGASLSESMIYCDLIAPYRRWQV